MITVSDLRIALATGKNLEQYQAEFQGKLKEFRLEEASIATEEATIVARLTERLMANIPPSLARQVLAQATETIEDIAARGGTITQESYATLHDAAQHKCR